MFEEQYYQTRLTTLQRTLAPEALYLISHPTLLTYFTGFETLLPLEREGFLVVSANSATVLHTHFAPVPKFSFFNTALGTHPSQLKGHLESLLEFTQATRLLYDPTTLFCHELEAIQDCFQLNPKHSPTPVSLEKQPQTFASEQLQYKDQAEITAIKSACQTTAFCLHQAQQQLTEGCTELQIADFIEVELKKNGCRTLAFPTIVAFGNHTAKPHHQPSDRRLEQNMPVLIDMGGKFQNYCADMTRTFWFGTNPTKKFLKIEAIVQAAYQAALETLKQHSKKKILAKNIDSAARNLIANQGFGDQFIHTTGHGLGIAIHEQPSLSWRDNTPIRSDMTVTIEPGIYFADEFGYRYENTLLTTQTSAENLTV